MERSEISLALAMTALSSHQDLVASNLANVSSTAYKRRVASFSSFASHLARAGQGGATVPAFSETIDFSPGDVVATGSDSHMAIVGPGFFKVRGHDGQPRFTRAGEISRDSQGSLVNADGLAFLGENDQPVRLDGDSTKFRVDNRGRVIDAAGAVRSQLELAVFADTSRLVPEGGGLFRAPKDMPPELDQESEIHQGSLERSNTDGVRELVSMITVQRAFQAASKVLSSIQSSQESLINATR
jgi:flagellar basal body rod protein FlgG